MRILVINGPNINMLGVREPEIYGKETYKSLVFMIENKCNDLGVFVECFQSNHEGVIVDKIQEAMGVFDGIVINPAAYTHTSIAIADALKCVKIPYVEIHISDVSKREEYRRISFIRENAINTIIGKGLKGYLEAIDYLFEELK